MSEKQKPQEVIPKEITQLLEHRATLEDWLAKLEELSGTVRPEVYDRVRGDYEERLRSQETELTAHRAEMEAALEERKTRVNGLESDRDERAAELEEAELRFAVGEFKEAEFQKHKSAHEEKLADLDAELTSGREALAKLEDVVGVLSGLRAGASGSVAAAGVSKSSETGIGEKAGPSWGTARGRSEEGAQGAVEGTKSAAAAAAVAVADALAADTAEEESLASGAADAKATEADAAEARGAEAKESESPEAVTEETVEPEAVEPEAAEPEATDATEAAEPTDVDGGDYLDDLEFLESLSMDEIDRLDVVSAMLEDESETEGGERSSEGSR